MEGLKGKRLRRGGRRKGGGGREKGGGRGRGGTGKESRETEKGGGGGREEGKKRGRGEVGTKGREGGVELVDELGGPSACHVRTCSSNQHHGNGGWR